MSHRLTAEELAEPDVTLVIPLDKWRQLPEEIKYYLRLCTDTGNEVMFRYTVPAYMVREFEAIARRQAEAQQDE